MKKSFLLSLLLALCPFLIQAHDFDLLNDDDVTIYYIRTAPTEVTVSHKGMEYYSYSNEYFGKVNIPSTVRHNGVTYSVTSIRTYSFYQCEDVTSVSIPETVTAIGDFAFYGCGAKTFSLPESLTEIGIGAFYKCKRLTSINLPSSLTSIPLNAFYNCANLESVTIHESLTEIGKKAFSNCYSLATLNIPNSVTKIGEDAFSECTSLTDVIIPNSVVEIGAFAFATCTGLKSVFIPKSVKSIGSEAFAECTALESITVDNPQPIELHRGNTFYNVPKTTCTLYVPRGSKELYATTNEWKEFENIEEYGPGPVIPGDVDGNGKITITDVVTICNMILSNPSGENFPEAADLDNDGKITITDVVILVNQILSVPVQ